MSGGLGGRAPSPCLRHCLGPPNSAEPRLSVRLSVRPSVSLSVRTIPPFILFIRSFVRRRRFVVMVINNRTLQQPLPCTTTPVHHRPYTVHAQHCLSPFPSMHVLLPYHYHQEKFTPFKLASPGFRNDNFIPRHARLPVEIHLQTIILWFICFSTKMNYSRKIIIRILSVNDVIMFAADCYRIRAQKRWKNGLNCIRWICALIYNFTSSIVTLWLRTSATAKARANRPNATKLNWAELELT